MLALVESARDLPFRWPGEPDAKTARSLGAGTCASKHALLAEDLSTIGVGSVPLLMVGPLIPPSLLDDPLFAPAKGLTEMHECLRVETPWAGPLLVDITWDPVVLAHGFRGTLPWAGVGDMLPAIAPDRGPWEVPREGLREAKERLRLELYQPSERGLRYRTLLALSDRFEQWRRLPGGLSACGGAVPSRGTDDLDPLTDCDTPSTGKRIVRHHGLPR